MRVRAVLALLLSLLFALSMISAEGTQKANTHTDGNNKTKSELEALAALEPVDTHTHVAKGDSGFYAMLDRLHMHILDILLVDDHDAYRKNLSVERHDALVLRQANPTHASLCTTFDPFQFNNPEFAASAIKGLDQDFASGAIAVKIWKNIGMELKDKNGRYVLADDPKFKPIYDDIEKHNRTLVAHQAEPDEAWLPPNPKGLDYPYYKENPLWYMFNKPGAPTKRQILDARDHLLAENPQLRVVGAHLGSMEDDLEGLSKRFDRYPNFAVDTAARVIHLVVMPTDHVRNFILKYQDRIVYGTDLGFSMEQSSSEVVKEWEDQYARDWRYFATRDRFEYEGHQTEGLGLPAPVLRKLYHANAVRWFPGIIPPTSSGQ